MKTANYKYSFHRNAGELASLSPDGKLRLWHANSGKLSHEWMPQSSLQITCSCLCWTYNKSENGRSRPKKEARKRSLPEHDAKGFLALGTLQGSVLLLDTDMLEIKNIVENEHTERINDICYNSVKETIYSASNDKNIVEFSYPSMNVKSKWKADKNTISKLETSPDGSCLLTAGRSIKLWDLDTKQLLQKFTGHVNPITSLHFVPVSNTRSYKDDCYFLSSAEEDQIVNAWHYDPSCKEKGAVSCFMTPDEPVAVDLTVSEEQQLHLSVACLDGRMNIFKHVLNGKMAKPISSSLKFQLVKRNEAETTIPKSHRLLALKLLTEDKSLLLVYGSPIRPTFERIDLSTLENGCRLERDMAQNFINDDSKTSKAEENSKRVEKTAVINSNVPIKTNIVPDNIQSSSTKGKTTKTRENQELTLEERLNANLAQLPETKRRRNNKNERPNAASLVKMLSQGLHSDDDKLIDNVLYKMNRENVIMSTVSKLPSSSVMTLLNKIVNRIQRNPARGPELTLWIRVLLNVHMTYLISFPNLMNRLSDLYQTLESRTKLYPKLSKLHGRLDLLLTHVAGPNTSQNSIDVKTPVLSFEDKDEAEEENDLENAERIQFLMDDETGEDEEGDDDEGCHDGDDDAGDDDDDDEGDDDDDDDDESMVESIEQESESEDESEE